MIKFIINPLSHSTVQVFYQKTVLIGSTVNREADFCIDGDRIKGIHVKIEEEENRFLIINVANDPFVTLNGLPFGKKSLKNGDQLLIGNTTIKIEVENTIPINQSSAKKISEVADTREKLEEILEGAFQSKYAQPIQSEPQLVEEVSNEEIAQIEKFVEEVQQWKEDDFSESEIEELVRQAELLDKPFEEHFDSASLQASVSPLQEGRFLKEKNKPADPVKNNGHFLHLENDTSKETASIALQNQAFDTQNKPPETPPVHRKSLKDYYLSEFDDENENWNPHKQGKGPSTASKIYINWKFWLTVLLSILLISAITGAIFYFNASGKSEEEEQKAAQSVSDVAMALTYAQINHIRPQNQNWSDPDFLKNNLTAVLAPEFSSLGNLDSQGRFNNTPYILRIYTSSDLSQFLVIAQPAPSLLQWMIPKTSIIVDSHAMEMRKTKDLKSLNRLLVNPSTLDGTNALEISNLVKRGELIALASLAEKRNNYGFVPPKALELIRKGAENLIYNAPRYYNFGENFLKKAIALMDHPSNSHDYALLQEQIHNLARFPNLVLYSSEGMQAAMQAQKAIASFTQSNKLLIAYLQFNTKGKITSSHLLMDDGFSDVVIAAKPAKAVEQIQPINQEEGLREELLSDVVENSDDPIDRKHPLFLKMNLLFSNRQQALVTFSEPIISLIHSSNTGKANFHEPFYTLSSRYDLAVKEENFKTVQNIIQLQKDYNFVPYANFKTYLALSGLEELVNEYLQSQNQQSGTFDPQLMEFLLENIQESDSLQSLNEIVEKASQLLTLEKLSNPEKIISYQNSIRAHVLLKLGQFILSAENLLPNSSFSPSNQELLAHIMKTAWVTDQDEFDFYMNEFELLVKQNENPNSENQIPITNKPQTATGIKWGKRFRPPTSTQDNNLSLEIPPQRNPHAHKFLGGKKARWRPYQQESTAKGLLQPSNE